MWKDEAEAIQATVKVMALSLRKRPVGRPRKFHELVYFHIGLEPAIIAWLAEQQAARNLQTRADTIRCVLDEARVLDENAKS